MQKKSKVLALFLCMAMLVAAMPLMAYAEGESLSIGEITKTGPVEGLITFTVPYTAENVDQVTILAVVGGEEFPEISEDGDNIGYIDQQDADTTISIDGEDVTAFQFVVEESRFSSENAYIHIKMGGTAIDSPETANPIIVCEDTTSFKVYGYVDVPAAVGATVSLGDGLSANTDANGYFEIEGVQSGSYTASISAKSAITRSIPIEVVDEDVELSTSSKKITLMFGDTDGNGKIELEDLLSVKDTFKKEASDALYNANFDLDSNGKIELEDLLTIKDNFKKNTDDYEEWVK